MFDNFFDDINMVAYLYRRMNQQPYILIADSGSTKCDWAVLQGEKLIQEFHTLGFNPYVVQADFIEREVATKLLPQLRVQPKAITSIFFYGTGCSTEKNCNMVADALTHHFAKAEIQVEHDMLGTVRATLGSQAGIAGILGTGSNCCWFDGDEIREQLISLGYLAGDEGSGNYLGKVLLQSYCYGFMPTFLQEAFYHKYQLTRREVTPTLFAQDRPNTYLASFTTFLHEQLHHPFIQQIIEESFKAHVEKNIFALNFPDAYAVSYVGSVAFYFQNELKKVLEQYGLQLNKVIQKPMQGLIGYYRDTRWLDARPPKY